MSQFNRRRRKFLLGSGAAALTIGFVLYSGGRESGKGAGPEKTPTFRPNAWLRVDPDGSVTVTLAKSEMGQGVWTSLPMLVAEELEVDWRAIRVEQATSDPIFGYQITGGSSSIRSNWQTLRRAGAQAREMLLVAAAEAWKVPKGKCQAQGGVVTHADTGRRLSYGELTEAASRLPVPKDVVLKDAKDFRVIGQSWQHFDIHGKVVGGIVYGMDVVLPGMLIATVTHCPVFGGKLKSVEASRALAVEGVRRVIEIDRGVAVVAENYWAARQGQAALVIHWESGLHADASSDAIREMFVKHAQKDGATAQLDGDTRSVFASAARKIEAVYELPFQAHATMEPMCCTAHVHEDGRCEVWAPTQSPSEAQKEAERYVISDASRIWRKLKQRVGGTVSSPVTIYTTQMGCGFGRRLQQDYVAEAVQISKAIQAPVKLVWSREEDTQHDFYRPATYNHLIGALNSSGRPVAWKHKIVGPSINESLWPGSIKDGLDSSLTEGATELPYTIPNFHVEYVMAPTPVPLGFWRSVGHSHNAFVTECFLDELAAAAGKDPLAFRLDILGSSPRARAVLRLAAEKAGWGGKLKAGRHHGLALHRSFRSFVAQVAEVSVNAAGHVRVHRVVCAIDCGIVINPDMVTAQMEGSVAFGLSAMLKGGITLRNGRVEQSNFHDYPVLRMSDMPDVETHIVTSREEPGGVGEPGVPPIAPAVANAIYAATGKRLRRLPIRPEDLRGA